ncbi:MAG TPA: hypothetical protein VFF09_02725 [archaeon]|nr:hypothetical protein [archaeon]
MALTTIFLLVLITAFGVGNVLLFFFRGKEEVSAQGDPAGEEGLTAYSSGEGAAAMLPGKEALLEKKIELAHKRIQELEKVKAFPAGAADAAHLEKKVRKLEGFRSTAEAEIIGIKEILLELQKKHIVAKSRVFKRGNKPGKAGVAKKISGKDLHRLAFGSGKKKKK